MVNVTQNTIEFHYMSTSQKATAVHYAILDETSYGNEAADG
jgi:hypothetical protein